MTDADKRIEALLERAGCPMMVVKNCKEGPEWLLKSNRDSHIWKLIDEKYGGTPAPFIQELVDTIDRLEGALENVIIERDAAMEKMPKWIQMTEETRPKSSGYYVSLVNSPQYGMHKLMLRYDAEDDDWYAGFEPYETCVNSRVTHWIDSLPEPPGAQKDEKAE